jgi:two-component system, cell cycle sensor histidine kinase and response regulator CckA
MTQLKMTELSFPSPARTIGALLLVLFCIETLIMYLLPHLMPLHNGYLENFADATLLTLLFSPTLYHRVFKPFQRIASQHKTLTDNVLAQMVDGVLIFDAQLVLQSVNGAAQRIFGYPEHEMVGSDLGLILPTRCLETVLPPGNDQRALPGSRAPLETSCMRPDGSQLAIELSLSPVQFSGAPMWLGIVRDITARKNAEERIQHTLSLLNATLDSTADGIIVRDLEGRSVIANQRFAQMFGIPETVLPGAEDHTLRGYVLEKLREPQLFANLVEKQGREPERVTCDILQFRDGRYFERVATPQIMEDRIVGRVVSYRDISEQKSLEHQLRHSQKMEALGTLAGGVAHDFNNILTVIMGYCNLSASGVERDDPLRHNLNQIMIASERAANLTNSLLAYSRKQANNPKPIDLNQCVQQVQKFLERLIGEQIELVARLDREKLTVLADTGQLEQVLMNLAANARDAMERRGSLIIGTGRLRIDAEFVRLHGYGRPGEFALLTVSDTGMGMSEDTREKIFEPFFTTKELGQGTGLGLSIVYGIVKQHEGYINVYSEPGHGTTFNIYLPLCADAQQAAGDPDPKVLGGSETILLAEDDQNVRALIRSVLSAQGYRVIEAVDGAAAVQKFADRCEQIDLLILDVVMPRKNGQEAYQEICALRPDMKAIFISGYTADIIDKNGLADQGLHLVTKPLLPSQLLSKVREVLG